MIRITLFNHAQDTQGTTIEAKPGHSLMKAAVSADIDGVAADCGGTLTCATVVAGNTAVVNGVTYTIRNKEPIPPDGVFVLLHLEAP